MIHIPVLQKEVIEYLAPKPNENFIDCTLGLAGHALVILEKNTPRGKVLGIEWDEELYRQVKREYLTSNIKKRLILVNDSYVNLEKIVKRERFRNVSGILLDLGISGWHIKESKRGFSFLRDEPLDMRYSLQNPLTAEKIINYWSRMEIERILKEFGQEQFAEKIAGEIINERKIKPVRTTFHLVKIIKNSVPVWYQHKKIHFATKTFQALRITVNDELENFKKVLPQTLKILKIGGRLAVISFHSLEDRIAKNFFKNIGPTRANLKIVTKKPVKPNWKEIKINPGSRSAKLRVVELSPIN